MRRFTYATVVLVLSALFGWALATAPPSGKPAASPALVAVTVPVEPENLLPFPARKPLPPTVVAEKAPEKKKQATRPALPSFNDEALAQRLIAASIASYSGSCPC